LLRKAVIGKGKGLSEKQNFMNQRHRTGVASMKLADQEQRAALAVLDTGQGLDP
jgi:hypothetical protein